MSRAGAPQSCPCGAPSLAACCGPFLTQAALPATAEQLMRSRYSAFVLRDEAYLLATWHPSTRPTTPLLDNDTKWLGLDVRARTANADSGRATVEFVARYKIGGRAHRLHEVSNFVREAGPDGARWYYVDGTFPEGGI